MQSHSTEKRPIVPTADAPFLHHAAAASVRERHWRNAFWGVTLVAGIALGDIAYLSGQIVVLPYVVAVRPGEMIATVGTVPSTFDLVKQPDVVSYVLREWLVTVRSLPTDPVAWQRQWEHASAFMGQKATAMLSPFKLEQKKRLEMSKAVTVEMLNTQPLAGTQGRTWEIDWRETTYSPQGYVVREESGLWHGTVKVAQMPPKPIKTTADHINPLRIFVEELSVQQRTKGQ
jgi:type IV secretory pathway TrbF-like protein